MSDERPPPSPAPPRKYPDLSDRMEALAILAEIRMERIEKQQAKIELLREQVTQRGARMQVMREWMDSGVELMGAGAWAVWYGFLEDHPEAAKWFNEDGTPR